VPRVTASKAVLPDLDALDPATLRALVIEKHALVIEKEAELASQHDEIQRLQLFIAKLQRMQFGPSSEKLGHHIDQLLLRLEDLETTDSKNHHCWHDSPLRQHRVGGGHCRRSCRVKPKPFHRKTRPVRIVAAC
jgi:transposase